MTSRYIRLVEAGLDEFFDWQRQTHGAVIGRRFTRTALAHCIEDATGETLSRRDTSHFLQRYLQAQDRPRVATAYRIGARGYARAALWYVHSGPGLDPLESEALVLAHVEWVTSDLARKAAYDASRELLPPASTFPAISTIVTQTATAIEQVLRQMVDRARAEADLYEQLTTRAVTMAAPLSPDEELMLATLNGNTP